MVYLCWLVMNWRTPATPEDRGSLTRATHTHRQATIRLSKQFSRGLSRDSRNGWRAAENPARNTQCLTPANCGKPPTRRPRFQHPPADCNLAMAKRQTTRPLSLSCTDQGPSSYHLHAVVDWRFEIRAETARHETGEERSGGSEAGTFRHTNTGPPTSLDLPGP